MNNKAIPLFIVLTSTSFIFAKHSNPFDSVHQEITAAFDDALQMINSAFNHSTAQITAGITSINSSITLKELDNKLEIAVAVPHIENSDSIKAYTAHGRLKIVAPQKDSVTKITIDKTGIRKVTKQHKKEKTKSKELKRFSNASSTQVEYQTLPFAVDLLERSIEYKNDMIIITLNKAKEPAQPAQAQPRIIQVTDKK